MITNSPRKITLEDLDGAWEDILQELKKGNYTIATISAHILCKGVEQFGKEQTREANK